MVLVFSSRAVRERVLSELNECIEFARAGEHPPLCRSELEPTSVKPVHAASKQPVPPLPKLNGIPQPHPTDGIQSSQTAPDLRQPSAPPMTSRDRKSTR